MTEITAEGTIFYEVPELTQAILQEAWLEQDDRVRFVFCSGDVSGISYGGTEFA